MAEYSDAVIDELWLNLRYIEQDLRAGRDVDIYWALDIIRILDKQERIYSQGQYICCRPYILSKARQLNVTPMFQVNLSAMHDNGLFLY